MSIILFVCIIHTSNLLCIPPWLTSAIIKSRLKPICRLCYYITQLIERVTTAHRWLRDALMCSCKGHINMHLCSGTSFRIQPYDWASETHTLSLLHRLLFLCPFFFLCVRRFVRKGLTRSELRNPLGDNTQFEFTLQGRIYATVLTKR